MSPLSTFPIYDPTFTFFHLTNFHSTLFVCNHLPSLQQTSLFLGKHRIHNPAPFKKVQTIKRKHNWKLRPNIYFPTVLSLRIRYIFVRNACSLLLGIKMKSFRGFHYWGVTEKLQGLSLSVCIEPWAKVFNLFHIRFSEHEHSVNFLKCL